MNPYVQYYTDQVGTGISTYAGLRYQKGHGFFGKIFKTGVMPIMRYLGDKVISTVADIGKDVISGAKWPSSAKKRVFDSGDNIAEALVRARALICQEGSGAKRRKTDKNKKQKRTRSVIKTDQKVKSIITK